MAKLDDLIQQKQQRDEDWKAKKTAEREELGQLSDDAVMHVTSEPGAYLHYLDTQAINPRYSASNVMLAMAQNPEITYINSLEVWNRLGRSVNRDENGMKIRVSDTYVKDGREYHGYISILTPMAMWNPVRLSTTLTPISEKKPCWKLSNLLCLWPITTTSPSIATTCVPAPCWRILTC